MNLDCIDSIFNIIDFLTYPDLISLTQVNQYFNNLNLVKIRKAKYVTWMNDKISIYSEESSDHQQYFQDNQIRHIKDKVFLMAVQKGDLHLVGYLIFNNYEPSRNRNQAVIDAIKFKQYPIFRELLNHVDLWSYAERFYACDDCITDDQVLTLILDHPPL